MKKSKQMEVIWGNRRIESAPEEVVIDTVAKWTAIPIPPIIIDGDFSDWESYSYTTIVDDPDL